MVFQKIPYNQRGLYIYPISISLSIFPELRSSQRNLQKENFLSTKEVQTRGSDKPSTWQVYVLPR